MQKTEQEQPIIVRGSAEHKDYLRYQFGRIKETVNGFETRIAVSGRAMLLIYVVYITVKAGVVSSLPANLPPSVTTGLLVLDIAMLALQVLGLEGSVPGLRHLAEELEDKGKTKEAGTVRLSSNIAQWLLAATAVDIILQKTPTIGSWDMTGVATTYTNCLFVLRVVVIGLYLVAMAKLEHKGPKVISAHEAARQAEEQEQKQIRIDNATIMAAVEQGITQWGKPMTEALRKSQETQYQQFLDRHDQERLALKAQVEALQMLVDRPVVTPADVERLIASQIATKATSLAPTQHAAEAALDVESLKHEMGEAMRQQAETLTHDVLRQVDARLRPSAIDIDVLTHDVLRQARASLAASFVDERHVTHLLTAQIDALKRDLLRHVDAKLETRRPASAPARQPSASKPAQAASSGSTSRPNTITEIGGMGKKAYFAAFEKDPTLLRLNPYELAEKFTGSRTMEPTARRAKKDYLEAHPELRDKAL